MHEESNMPKQPQTPENKSGEARPANPPSAEASADKEALGAEAEAEQQRKDAMTERD